APAEVLRLLQSSAAVVADAKTIKDVQSNIRLVAQELEARTERLASCLSGITGDLDGVKHQTERLLNAASDHHVALNNANGKFKELGEQIQQIESAVTHMSRRQVAFESTMETRLGALENQIIQLQTQATSADALRDEVASMKAALSSLEHQQPTIQQSAQIKSEESETRIQRRMDEMDVLLKHFFERVDGNEKLCEKLRQRSEDLTSRFETWQTHVDVGFSGESGASSFRRQPRMPQQIAEEVHYERFEEAAKAQEIIETETPKHRTTSGVQMFQMTPQRDGAEDPWQKDAVDEWLDQEEDPQVVQSAIPSSLKQPALEKGTPNEAVSTIALMETVSEVLMPGGITEQATSHGIILQGVACYAQEVETGQATHEKIANKGKGAKGKSGKDGKDAGNSSSEKGKQSSKGDAKATADVKAAEEAKAEAAQEAKAKAKAEKRAAKAAAKAAASAKASSVVTVASAVSEEVPSSVGAVGLTSSRSTAPRVMMAQSLDCESDDVSGSESLESEIPMRAEGDTPEWSEVERGDFSSAEPSSDEGEDEDQHRQLHPLRLWVLNLTIEDFVMWTRKAVARASKVPFIATPQATATAFPKARAVARAPRGGGATVPTAMRCLCVEEEPDWEPPMLVGARAEPIIASRLECIDHPAGSAVISQQPSVLVDSGANETIRPWLADIKECTRTAVVTARGDRVAALRTRDGELCIKSTEDSRDWLLSVRRLVEAGGTFKWDREAATVSYLDSQGHEQRVDCRIQNGLPFLDWEELQANSDH
ncbi:unnamed protein product, partial [Symbiodinium necroappetens]